MKECRKEETRIKRDIPKLFALMLQYLSDESLEAVQRQKDWDDVENQNNAEKLWKYIEETHKISTISQVALITKLSARSTYQHIQQGTYQSIIMYKEQFNNVLKVYADQGNPKITDEDIAMDFLRGLDNARYAGFKTEIMNLLTTEMLTQPANLNVMFQLKVDKKSREKGKGGKNKRQQQRPRNYYYF
jgi:hypothetical protein